jgi:acyl-coenzyme A thioesterase PaaI-like protein
MTADEINAFYRQAFPSGIARVDFADGKIARVRLAYDQAQLRPGGTLSGPTMMGLADMAMYTLVLSSIGFVPLAVTTNLSINFLRKPEPRDLIAKAACSSWVRRLRWGTSSSVPMGAMKSWRTPW